MTATTNNNDDHDDDNYDDDDDDEILTVYITSAKCFTENTLLPRYYAFHNNAVSGITLLFVYISQLALRIN